MMGSLKSCKSNIYNERKALILQSLRDITTQKEWEKEKTKKINTNCIIEKNPLKNVQNKIKEQLLEEKWAIEKKLCSARKNLNRAKKRREEAGYKLHAINKKCDFHCNYLKRILRQHQLIVSSHSKVLNYETNNFKLILKVQVQFYIIFIQSIIYIYIIYIFLNIFCIYLYIYIL